MRIAGGTRAIAVLAILFGFLTSRAGAQLCGPSDDPCQVTGNVQLPSGTTIDIGERALVVKANVTITVLDAGQLNVLAGRVELETNARILAPGFGGFGGDVAILTAGAVSLASGAKISVAAQDQGGAIAIETVSGAVTIEGTLDAHASNGFGQGGVVEIQSGVDLLVDGIIDASGPDGRGAIGLLVAGSIGVNGTISAVGTAFDGTGGHISVEAGGAFTLPGTIDLHGGTFVGTGGGVVDVIACTVDVDPTGKIDAGPLFNDGDAFLGAAQTMKIGGTLIAGNEIQLHWRDQVPAVEPTASINPSPVVVQDQNLYCLPTPRCSDDCKPGFSFLDVTVAPAIGSCGVTRNAISNVIDTLDCGQLRAGGGGSVWDGVTMPTGSTHRFGLCCQGASCTVQPTSVAVAGTRCTDHGCRFGPPIPIAVSILGMCAQASFADQVSGTLAPGTGALSAVAQLSVAFVLTNDLTQPCPICRAGHLGGVPCAGSPDAPCVGVCEGGPNQQGACTSRNAQGISDDCAAPAAFTCYRGTNNGGICVANADCPGGFCTAAGGTLSLGPLELTTDPVSVFDAAGEFCPGQTPSNRGCFKDSVPGAPNDALDCRTIETTGTPAASFESGVTAPVIMTAVGCSTATVSAIINAALSLPGPAALSLAANVTPFDGCPGAPTSTTTNTTSTSMSSTIGSTSTVPTTTTSSTTAAPSSTTTSTVVVATTSTIVVVTTSTVVAVTTTSSGATTSAPASTTSTSSTTSTTSTTAEPFCGDGTTDGDEECDFRDPAISAGCCTSGCRFRTVGYPCGDDSEDDCDEADSCDASGHCRTNRVPSTVTCRVPGDRGECDVGAKCDGVNAECPLTGSEDACNATIPDDPSGVIPVTCDAGTEVLQGGKSLCDATGFDGDAAGGLTGGQAGAVTATQPITQPIKPKKQKMLQVKGQPRRTRTVTLRLNKLGKQLLKARGGTLRVRVVARVRNGGTNRSPIERVVTLRRK